jgi:hypothetical protein
MVVKKSSVAQYDRPAGLVHGVIVDISDSFMKFNKISGENKPTSVWTYQLLTTYRKEDGSVKRHLVSEYITPSLHEKAKMRARLDGLAGRRIPDAEIPDQFDTGSLIGVNCVLNLIVDEGGYNKIVSISALAANTTEIKAEGYVRPEWITKEITEATSATRGKVDPGPASNAAFLGSLKTSRPSQVPVDLNRPLTANGAASGQQSDSTTTAADRLSLGDILKAI